MGKQNCTVHTEHRWQLIRAINKLKSWLLVMHWLVKHQWQQHLEEDAWAALQEFGSSRSRYKALYKLSFLTG